MDFATLMSAQISKSKAPSSSSDSGKSKYLKRSEVESARQAAHTAEQARLDTEREEKAAKKRKLEDEEAERNRGREEKKRRLADESKRRREEEEAKQERLRKKRLGLPPLPDRKDSNSKEGTPLHDEEEVIPDEELWLRLRELDEPAVLFGESHRARLHRYKRLTKKSHAPQLTDGPIPTTLQLVPEAEMKVPLAVPPQGTAGRCLLFRQLASYFTMVLQEWDLALSRREQSVKESYAGKGAHNAMVQSRENMRPLFKKFEKGDIDEGVLKPVVEIVRCAQERRYVDANDGYLRLSIGKAAWPIGVTMVGIHERSAREKLHESDNQAHIMSDEVTRKFLQSIKRCLSFAQIRWPPDDQLQLMG